MTDTVCDTDTVSLCDVNPALQEDLIPRPVPASHLLGAGQAVTGLPLPEDTVHLWLVALSTDDQTTEYCLQSLSPDEQSRAQSFLSEPARHRYIISRAVLRRILRRYHEHLPADFPIARGSFGKPFLENTEPEPAVRFNISHSGNLVLMGFSANAEVGVDIEKIRQVKGLMGVAGKVLSDAEFSSINALPDPEKPMAFFRLWTCKEASLKADGTGFQRDPRSLCLYSESASGIESSRLIQLNQQTIRWAFQPAGYSLAWAVKDSASYEVRWMYE